MPMQREHEDILEQSRNDKIKALGFLCYNLHVDGTMFFPEMNEMVDDIKKTLNYLLALRQSNSGAEYLQIQEKRLNEKLVELGCICYNLYVDNKLFNSEILSLCNSISSINREITDGLKVASQQENLSGFEESKRSVKENKNVTQSKLKITCPYGMEPIPANFKRCICGYRNKPEARFCGKCGAKLA